MFMRANDGKAMFMRFLTQRIGVRLIETRLLQSCPPHWYLIGTGTPSQRVKKIDKVNRNETKLRALVSQIWEYMRMWDILFRSAYVIDR